MNVFIDLWFRFVNRFWLFFEVLWVLSHPVKAAYRLEELRTEHEAMSSHIAWLEGDDECTDFTVN